jgi:hypothetical protein
MVVRGPLIKSFLENRRVAVPDAFGESALLSSHYLSKSKTPDIGHLFVPH